jgi:hypothetical protein
MSRDRGERSTLPDRLVDMTREWMFGRVMPRALLRSLEQHLEDLFPGRERELIERIEVEMEPIATANAGAFPDHAGQDLLGICVAMLAAYRVLLPEIGDEERTIELLRHIARGFGQRSTRLATRLLMRKPGAALDTIERFFKATAPVLGEAWAVEYARDGARSFEMRFTRCGFHDFMVRNGVERLTTAFCAWDRTWLDEIDPQRDGIQASRPTTLGYGGAACPFQFHSVETPERTRDPA